ncbi:hypothetical protein PVAND_011929 [Polypedilum vanderplanki]|uniref:Nose resistant-to-fluoxetine protein N-terminal domain-containing protein n=1 Tax=Polypedilum vanderplanki TaxID=319348 RepID=A0A9J6CKW8_POLVA|nr:hypothetical protein PVAND_011929 [Polypedilum vanderplanki]
MAKVNLILIIGTITLLSLIVRVNCIINFSEKVKVLNNLVSGNDLSQVCNYDLQNFLKNVDKNSSIVHKMLEAWSTFKLDYKYGNSYDFGNFKECMKIVGSKYCTIQYYYQDKKITPVKPDISVINFGWKHLSTRFGGAICLPDSCSSDDIKIIMKNYFDKSGLLKADDYNQNKYCKTSRTRNEIDYKLILFFFIVFFLITIVVISTILSKKFSYKIFQCFSLENNLKSFLNISNVERQISSIDGLKGISIILVFVLHYMGCVFGFPFKDGKQVAFLIESRFLQVINFAGMTTENFFILSGLIVVQSIGKVKKQKTNVSKLMPMFQLYIRFFFPVLFLLLTHMLTSSYFFNNTPFYNISTQECKKYWWTTLLHLQVYFNPGEICLLYSWYLTVTFHIILFLPIIFMITKNVPRKYVFLVYSLLMVLTIISRFVAFNNINLSIEIPELYNIKSDFFKYVFYPSHTRATSFFAGMLLGDLIKNNTIQSMVSKQFLKCLLLILFISMMLYNLSFVLQSETFKLGKYNLIISSTWYIVCFSIIILLSHLYDGPLKRFLSKQIWIYISKLSLCIYLMGTHMQFLLVSLKNEPLEVNNFYIFIKGISVDFVLMIIPIFFLHFFVEVPFSQFGKLMTKKLCRNASRTEEKMKEN